MKRPSFQFYPSDWLSDPKLRRLTHELKGVWIDTLCVLHGEDVYGVFQGDLDELAISVGTSLENLQRLLDKGVLKGGTKDTLEPYIYVSKAGDEIDLLEGLSPPLWYCGRLVKDEHVRKVRGRHGKESQKHPSVPKPKRTESAETKQYPPMDTFGNPTKDTLGRGLGGSPSSSSSSSVNNNSLSQNGNSDSRVREKGMAVDNFTDPPSPIPMTKDFLLSQNFPDLLAARGRPGHTVDWDFLQDFVIHWSNKPGRKYTQEQWENRIITEAMKRGALRKEIRNETTEEPS